MNSVCGDRRWKFPGARGFSKDLAQQVRESEVLRTDLYAISLIDKAAIAALVPGQQTLK